MISSEAQIKKIEAIAARAYPRETVAAVMKSGVVIELENSASNPLVEFAVIPTQWREVASGCAALVHSHPDGPAYPSEADMRTQIALGIPFGIVVSTPQGAGGYFEWGGNRPSLCDRPFRHGVTDCYGLIRDYFSEQLGIVLQDYARGWEWWEEGKNLYLELFSEAGFYRVRNEDLQAGDMIMFRLRGEKPAHAGLYIGNGEIMHHLGGSKGYDPTRKPMVDGLARWQKFIHGVYRHKDV